MLRSPQPKTADGILDFLGPKGYYWGEISSSQANILIQKAKRYGYKYAVNWLETFKPGMSEYILSYSRADWIYAAINPAKIQTALDIGSGWGAITFALSHHVAQVWSLESVMQRIKFQQIRAEQENRTNIQFVRSDWLNLPFADNSFDLVSVNGVLEWIGLSDYSQSPQTLQKHFLSEIYRVLKPGGCLYIGIENRLAFFLFLGSLDHSGLPFTSLVPRFVADYAVRRLRKTHGEYVSDKRMSSEWPDYRTYTYTKWGYDRLLRRCGFNSVHFQWTLAYNSPSESGYFDTESFPFLLRHFREHDFSITISSKLATRFGSLIPHFLTKLFFPLFSPGFLIYAYKGHLQQSFEQKLVSASTSVTSFVRRSGTHGLNSKIIYFLLKDGRPVQLAKFSRFPGFDTQLIREQKILAQANSIPVSTKIISGRRIFFEPYLNGRICQTLSLADNQKAIYWLQQFQYRTQSGYWSKDSFVKYALKFISIVRYFPIAGNNRKRFDRIFHDFIESSRLNKIAKVDEHGDFVKTNIIIATEKIYVLDWEFYQPHGCPLFDLLLFIISNSRSGDGFVKNFTGTGSYSPIIKKLFQSYSKSSGLSVSFLISAVPYNIVRSLARRFQDVEGKHLDTKPLLDLLILWCNIYQQAKLWINSTS